MPALTGEAVGFEIHPQAVVECAPGVGSYVGGDITAGLLCTDLATNHDEVFLFLDIGTNGEIVVGNADWMVGCACSAGPAFEGVGHQVRHARHRAAPSNISKSGGQAVSPASGRRTAATHRNCTR